jgi:hypothetical protein
MSDIVVLIGMVALSGSNPFFQAKKATVIEMTATSKVNIITAMMHVAMKFANEMVSTPVAKATEKLRTAI